MKKACVFVSKCYKKNKLFDIMDKKNNRDDCLYPWYLLKNKLRSKNIDLSTQDINTKDNCEFVLFSDLPKDINVVTNKNSYLILFESQLIRPDNWIMNNHKSFKKVFTWHDDMANNGKYVKYFLPNKIPQNEIFNLENKTKFCTLIAGNKSCKQSNELYSERVKTIRWFEDNYPNNFDLYGVGWDRYNFTGMLSKLNRFSILTKTLKPNFPSYKGCIASKNETLKKYKFAICYENVKDIKGYITEKIFDCFFAACIPIYWGAQNIADFIPKETFIDRRNFKNNEEMYNHLKNISESEYFNYIANIENYIKGDKIYKFSAENFADTIINNL